MFSSTRLVRRFSTALRESQRFIAAKGAQAYYEMVKPDVTDLPVDKAVDQLLNGCGFVIFQNLYTPEQIKEAQATIAEGVRGSEPDPDVLVPEDVNTETGYDRIYANSTKGQKQGKLVWNILNKAPVFEAMVQQETVMQVLEGILGHDFCLGSYAANCMQPGAQGQNAHVDYPYWDYNDKRAWVHKPKMGPGHPFHMNMQTLVMLDDFRVSNGATALIPFSQLEASWPD